MRQPFQQYQKTCKVCGKKFMAKRAHAEFCSSTCRTTHVRNRDKEQEPVKALAGGGQMQLEDVDVYMLAQPPQESWYKRGLTKEQAVAEWVKAALPKDTIAEWNEVLFRRWYNLRNNYGKDSVQAKRAMDVICAFSPPRIEADRSVWLGTNRLK